MSSILIAIKKNLFLIILTIVIGLFGILPLIIKPTAPYYSFDPDPAYVANALEYVQIHKIFFTDHPGTPVIIFLSLLFLPIKVFEYFIHAGSFSYWVLQNFSLLMWIAKFSVFTMFLAGVYFFQLAFYKLFKSYLVNLFLCGILFFVPSYYAFQGVVTPENFGLFFTSIWFYFIAKYRGAEKSDFLVMASVFSGLASASKLTFIFVFISTLIISFYKKSITKSLLTAGGFIGGFVLGTLPVFIKRENFNAWISYLQGREAEFSPSQIISTNWFGANYIFLILIAVFGLLIFTRKDMKIYGAIFLSAFAGLFAFAKYTSFHYQYGNFLLIALCSTVLFAQLRKKEMIIILIILAFFTVGKVKSDFAVKRTLVASSANIENYVNGLPKDGFYIWDAVGSEEYALIRGKEWSNWFYAPELKVYKPNLWYINPHDLATIINNDGQRYSIDDFCWDGLFLDSNNLERFLMSRKNGENYKVSEIPGTNVSLVTQVKCSNVPHPQSISFVNQ